MKDKKLNFIKFLVVILLYSICITKSYSMNNKIVIKINNEIVTSLDLENETKYLFALNPSLKNLKKNEITDLSKKSILQEKIKKIEIENNFKNIKLPQNYLEKLLKNIYLKIGIQNLEDFKKYLKLNEVEYEVVLDKIRIEALWNELIFVKFSKKLKINEENLKNKINQNIKLKSRSYLMSEIFFEINKDEKIVEKYKEIITYVEKEGFENAALKYSISETARIGGKLNWINANSLNEKIIKQLEKIKIQDITSPITVPGGFLVLKINDIKTTKPTKNLDEELQELIKQNKNFQLNQYSKMYFNKIKQNLEINEI